MTQRVKYNCSICNRSGTGYREKKGDSEENIPPDNWLHVGGTIYLCDKCADNPDALQKAELKVKKERRWNRFIFLGKLVLVEIVIPALKCTTNFPVFGNRRRVEKRRSFKSDHRCGKPL